MKTAKLLKTGLLKGNARLYRLSEPCDGHEYVVVSAIPGFDFGFMGPEPETYIFGADSEGQVQSYLELPGSFRGEQNHEEALLRAGYEVENG